MEDKRGWLLFCCSLHGLIGLTGCFLGGLLFCWGSFDSAVYSQLAVVFNSNVAKRNGNDLVTELFFSLGGLWMGFVLEARQSRACETRCKRLSV